MWLFGNKDSQEQKVAKIEKDMFGNDIRLDSNGNVILRAERIVYSTIFDDELKKIPITDKEFLKQDSLRATRLLHETNAILQSSPFKSYKPIYFDPTLKTNPAHKKEFESFRNLYTKAPIKKAIAPWTKKEKAYYESLQTKRERYQYLVIRSGLRSAVIDIPFDAIGGVDENGRVINPEYEEIFYEVDSNKNTLRSYLHGQEWGIAAGILGNPEELSSNNMGFQARHIQAMILDMQIDGATRSFLRVNNQENYVENVIANQYAGLHKNLLRKKQLEALVKRIKPDRFGMLPYIDEILGVDWIMDFSQYDIYGDIIAELFEEGIPIEQGLVTKGLLKDPRDADSTKESREKFRQKAMFLSQRRADGSALDYPYSPDFGPAQSNLEDDITTLYAKIRAVTPPQGYPNAPYYYIPEYLDELYEAGKLDKLLNPTIPAIYRESFPQELRDKIEWYAKKHNIKE
ncbi:hypothetical protein LS77_009865 [Helicobacter bilis]|uniref:Uncharacterized protein n=3 Tax=Helicobacter bilis TaxID=37372 RepID=A0A6D2C6R2_9HELI|nr:hypothetical protein [Helicobacter bilis]EMZ36261.1 hypothetical protein C826_02415 [Helicobacter bilis WiWa]TLE02638.1 hypothetical protein LS77_009865 [Helicobacter bilis]TLE03731.1 hypothetical protein LS76_009945 [Helicobacter bilis]